MAKSIKVWNGTSWVYAGAGASLPDQAGHAGEILSTDGTNPEWVELTPDVALPPQAGNANKYLKTDGTTASWDVGVTQAPVHAVFAWAGSLAVVAGASMRWYVHAASTILGVQASLITASTSGSVIVDVNKNGGTIFTTQGNRPTMAATSNYSGYVTTMDITTLAAGDYLTVDIDSAGTNAANLLVVVRYIPT